MIPPARKIVVEKSAALVAARISISFSRVNRNPITTVANTSKKPSTREVTIHQRQYSAVTRWLR